MDLDNSVSTEIAGKRVVNQIVREGGTKVEEQIRPFRPKSVCQKKPCFRNQKREFSKQENFRYRKELRRS